MTVEKKKRLPVAGCRLQEQRQPSFPQPATCNLQPLLPLSLFALPSEALASAGAGSALEMLGSLMLVLVVIFALAWLVRTLQGSRLARGAVVQLQGGVQVGAKEKVVLLQVGDTQLLVGVAPGSVNLLHRFEQPVTMPQASSELPAFADKLREMLRRGGGA